MDANIDAMKTSATPARKGANANSANATADKAIEILLLFSPAKPLWTQQEISTHLDMSRSTTYRYITSLRATGLIVQDVRGSFCLGPRLLHMAQAARMGNPVITLAQEPMRELSERFGEIVVLNERVGQEILTLDRIDSPHRIGLKSTRTHLLPWPATGSAKILLAYCRGQEFEELFAQLKPTAYTPQTIPTPVKLREHLKMVLRQGFAVSDEERDEGVWGVSVPLPQGDDCRHALSVVGPKFRLSTAQRASIVDATVEAGRLISKRMSS
jgi:DNA-binding IclR family transcriptional regulator